MTGSESMQSIEARARGGDAAAQYRLAGMLSGAGRREEAEIWLRAAADNGFGDALYTLATRLLYKFELAAEAARGLERAAAAGSSSARRLLCVLRAMGVGVDCDDGRALNELAGLAEANDGAARRELAAVLTLGDVNDPQIAQLIAGFDVGDPVGAAFALARRKAGRPSGGELSKMSAYLKAIRYPRAALLSSDADKIGAKGDAVDWRLIGEKISLDPKIAVAPERLSQSPDVVIYRGAIAPELCEYAIAHAASRLGPSLVYDPTAARMIRDPLRTSATASLSPIDLDLALVALARIAAAAVGLPDENGEFISVLHYSPGQEYRPHFDCIPPGPDLDASGQRAKTALMILNDDYEGGETVFPDAGLSFRGRQGDILVFSNLTEAGELDRASRHAGAPITSGVKWIATRWFRTRPYKF